MQTISVTCLYIRELQKGAESRDVRRISMNCKLFCLEYIRDLCQLMALNRKNTGELDLRHWLREVKNGPTQRGSAEGNSLKTFKIHFACGQPRRLDKIQLKTVKIAVKTISY